jgi:transcriptional regulator with XRE-family HTH domain
MIKVRVNQDVVQIAMAKRNMSQNMLAIRAGISSGYISQLMCGTRYPSPRIRQKILDVLGMDFDEVFVIERDERELSARR